MSALKSISLAIELARRKRDQLGKSLLQAEQATVFAKNQLHQLESYCDESSERWVRSAQVSAVPELMRHHYQFMDRLQHAITLQYGVIEGLERQVDEAKKLALEAEFRMVGLNQVLARKQAVLNRQIARREQNEMDELAGLLYRRKPKALTIGEEHEC